MRTIPRLTEIWQTSILEPEFQLIQSKTGERAIMAEQDMFKSLFEMQGKLNKRIGVDTDSLTEKEQQEWVLNYCRAMSQEIAELVDSVPWKWWAKYQDYDKQNARIEVVDLFHFLISLAQVLGMSAQDVHDIYMKKNELNFQRQHDGYKVKDDSDNRGIET